MEERREDKEDILEVLSVSRSVGVVLERGVRESHP